jgi:hypothetical protein
VLNVFLVMLAILTAWRFVFIGANSGAGASGANLSFASTLVNPLRRIEQAPRPEV